MNANRDRAASKATIGWRRVSVIAALVAGVVAGALVAPLAHDAWIARQQRLAQEPAPLPATDAEQAAITRAILMSDITGNSGQTPLMPMRMFDVTVLRDTTVVIVPCRDPMVASEWCEPSGSILWDEYEVRDTFPLKFRRELVLVNAKAGSAPDPGVPGVVRVDLEYPPLKYRPGLKKSVRLLSTSRAAMTPDRRGALVYIENDINVMWGRGGLVMLVGAGDDWRIERSHVLWME